jgi:hypothetical protein
VVGLARAVLVLVTAVAALACGGGQPAPRVVALIAGTSAVSDGDLVPTGALLRLTFSTAMRTGSVRLLADQAPLGLRWADDRRSAALGSGALRIGPVELAIAPGAVDAGGRALGTWRLAFRSVFDAAPQTVPLRAPALVQVPNDPAARDQAGLQAAAIVYEYLTEGGITRFTAIYEHAPDAIGPVRSGRLISFALTRHYGGMLFASGLSEGSAAVLRAHPVPYVFDSGGVYHRTGDRAPPNNLFTTGAEVQRALDGASLTPRGLPRGPVPIASGPVALAVDVSEHASTYAFDRATRTYTKQVDGRTLMDAATGQPLRIQLLVVLHTTATPTGYVEDVNGQPGLDFDMESGGRADFAFDGLQATGRWTAPDPAAPLHFRLDGGAMVTPPPLTWVDVVTG